MGKLNDYVNNFTQYFKDIKSRGELREAAMKQKEHEATVAQIKAIGKDLSKIAERAGTRMGAGGGNNIPKKLQNTIEGAIKDAGTAIDNIKLRGQISKYALRKESEKQAQDEVNKLMGDFAKAYRSVFGKTGRHNGYDSAAEDPNVEFDENGDIHPKGSSSDQTTEPGVEETTGKAAVPTEVENEDDYITFSYQPGDNFGQKIIDLGLATGNGLWGDNGDVNFYTQQLVDGGYLDANGNVKLGVPIRLKRRK